MATIKQISSFALYNQFLLITITSFFHVVKVKGRKPFSTSGPTFFLSILPSDHKRTVILVAQFFLLINSYDSMDTAVETFFYFYFYYYYSYVLLLPLTSTVNDHWGYGKVIISKVIPLGECFLGQILISLPQSRRQRGKRWRRKDTFFL